MVRDGGLRSRGSRLVDRVQRFISNQLYLVRRAVDVRRAVGAELEYGLRYACTVEAMRSPPSRPLGVHEFVALESLLTVTDAGCS